MIKRESIHLDALAATLTAINNNFGAGNISFMNLGHIAQGHGYVRRKFQYGGDEREFWIEGQGDEPSRFVHFLGKRIKIRSPYNDNLPAPPVMVVPVGGFDRLRLFHLTFPWVERINYDGLWHALRRVLADEGGELDYRNEPDPRWGEFRGRIVHVANSTDSTNNILNTIHNNALRFCTPGKVGAEELRQYQKYPLPAAFTNSILARSINSSNAASLRRQRERR